MSLIKPRNFEFTKDQIEIPGDMVDFAKTLKGGEVKQISILGFGPFEVKKADNEMQLVIKVPPLGRDNMHTPVTWRADDISIIFRYGPNVFERLERIRDNIDFQARIVQLKAEGRISEGSTVTTREVAANVGKARDRMVGWKEDEDF